MARQAEVALADIDLSLPQYRILHLLAEGAALPSSLAARLDVRRPSITAVVDGLVARALVVRATDPADRRRVTHTITAEGRRLLEQADCSIDRRLEEVAGALGDPAGTRDAIEGLRAWGPALVAWHEHRHEAKPIS
jgi:long-chain acyl-CoA synthetase